jgi:hypothetical protein
MDAEGGGSPDHKHEFGKETRTIRVLAKRQDGKPAASLPVSLLVTLDGAPKQQLAGRTDAKGVAIFAKVPWHEHASYTALAPFGGVNYYASVRFEKGKSEASAVLQVAPTTQESNRVRIGRAHLIIDPSRDGVRVSEVLLLQNDGDKTYSGEPLSLPLFEGAHNLRAEEAVPGTYQIEGSELRYRGYVRPGQSQLHFEYHMPLTGTFERKTVLPIERLFVVLTRANFRLSGAVFKSIKKMSRNNAEFLLAQGGPVAAGGTVSFQVAPPKEMMARMAGAGMSGGGGGEGEGAPKGEIVKDWRVVAKWLAPLAALFIFFIAVYLASRREDSSLALADEASLAAERDRLLPELAAATRRAEGGEKGAARRQAELTRRLADVYRLLDEHAARRALREPPAPSGKPTR